MITLVPGIPAFDVEKLSLFHTQEPLLGNLPFLVFYGPSTKVNSTQNSSRVQAHVYSLGGFQSFPRLTIAPTSPLYVAVHHLPHDLQGDEISRGLAISILSYFSGLSEITKARLREVARSCNLNGSVPAMFDEMHAAQLASRMDEASQVPEVAQFLKSALTARALSWVDIDVILPPGSIKQVAEVEDEEQPVDDNGLPFLQFDRYNTIIETLGSSTFMPTNKLQRAPSKATTHNRSKQLSKEQKVSLRKEMCEFVDTESSYLNKLRNLVLSIAPQLRQRVRHGIWQDLFPESLNTMMKVNESFYQEVQSILDTTEVDAIRDIETDSLGIDPMLDTVTSGRKKDPTGLVPFARVLAKLFPTFETPYQDYLRASGRFSFIISQLLCDKSSEAWGHVDRIGEQQLRSALIEPVQRLPRYSLFIDNILQLLPTAHAARHSLLEARDVVTKICTLDNTQSVMDARLPKIWRNIIDQWPAHFNSPGRLITALDAVELKPPYEPASQGLQMVLMLFPGKLIILHKLRENAMSARGLLAESSQSGFSGSNFTAAVSPETSLGFESVYQLRTTRISESSDGLFIDLAGNSPSSTLPHETLNSRTRVFYLQAPYQGKAARFLEEVAKSKIEERHSIEVRESGKWSLRCMEAGDQQIGLLAAVTELKQHQSLHDQYNLGLIRLVVDDRKAAESLIAKNAGAMIVAHMEITDNDACILDMESVTGLRFQDRSNLRSVSQIFRTRLQSFLCSKDAQGSQRQISFDANVLVDLPLDSVQRASKQKGTHPRSPVKLLSTMLGSVANQKVTPLKARSRATTIEETPQKILILSPSLGEATEKKATTESPSKQIRGVGEDRQVLRSSLGLLEEAFASYLVALRSRSGNVVGKILQARSSADELAINELYNTLLEDPGKLEAAAVVSVDVLFAAFEKFLRVAWRERMGPLLAPNVAKAMQTIYDAGDLKTFRSYFQNALEESSPQNKRAFAATLKLLSDLLDASGNDGDRGVLVASFTEALILTGNPHDYIMLFDRLVDDYDIMFDDLIDTDGLSASNTSSLSRNRSLNASSWSSNTSSFRRRLGLGGNSTRDNGKNETESKVTSIWRTLSKNARSPGETFQTTNSSKTSLLRSKSTDTDARMLPPLRPISRERPPTASSSTSAHSNSRPESSHFNVSGLVGSEENQVAKRSAMLRRKRRSSLSDLQNLRQADISESVAPLKAFQVQVKQGKSEDQNDRSSANLHQQRTRLSPQRSGIPRFRSPDLKEKSPVSHRSPTKQASKRSDRVHITSYTPTKCELTGLQLPTSRTGLTERPWPPNSANIQPHLSTKSPPKMRIQSPQKLRQRLSQEQRNSTPTDEALQAEMNGIGKELSALTRPATAENVSSVKHAQKDFRGLALRLDTLQKQLTKHVSQPVSGKAIPQADVETKLLVAEKKVAKLDELYKESNAENEALYERFNDELSKVLARVRTGEGVDELRSKLGEAQGEICRLQAENAKLKRSVVDMRSSLPSDKDRDI